MNKNFDLCGKFNNAGHFSLSKFTNVFLLALKVSTQIIEATWEEKMDLLCQLFYSWPSTYEEHYYMTNSLNKPNRPTFIHMYILWTMLLQTLNGDIKNSKTKKYYKFVSWNSLQIYLQNTHVTILKCIYMDHWMKLPAPFKWLLANYVQGNIKAFHKSSIQLKLYLILHLSIILM